MKGAVSSLGPGSPAPTPLAQTPIKPVPRTMAVAKGTRAPMESLLFTDQCVYLSRKHLLHEQRFSSV